MTLSDRTLVKLLRLAFGTDDGTPLRNPDASGWLRLIDKSYDHGLPSVVVDGLQLALDANPDLELTIDAQDLETVKYDWLSGVFQDEEDNREFVGKLRELCGVFTESGIRPVLLKGIGLGADYPVPEHRPVGDIDLFLLDEGGGSAARRGDLLMRQKFGIEVTKTLFGRHSHAFYRGIPIENHYALGSPDSGRGNAVMLDARMRDLIVCGLRPVPQDNDADGRPLYYLPSADFNAVFLMWHLASHFCYERLLLRQLSDWMVFLKAHNAEVHWDKLRGILQDAGLIRFATVIDGILVKYLGMPRNYVPQWALDTEDDMVDRVMEEIMSCPARSFRFLSNVSHYFTDAWKYRLTGGRHWLIRFADSIRRHIFCGSARKELPVR